MAQGQEDKTEGQTVKAPLMEFRLIYQGPLYAQSDSTHKHEICKKIHRELKELWNTHPALEPLQRVTIHEHDVPTGRESHRSRLGGLADSHRVGKFRFAPFVSEYYGLLCSLDILFLRRGSPGKALQSGDLDSRIKTLLDALRKPTEKELPNGASPDSTENPFFCLLEDDALVTQMRITTDRLLVPEQDSADEVVQTIGLKHPDSKVYLVITVRTLIADSERAYIEFGLH